MEKKQTLVYANHGQTVNHGVEYAINFARECIDHDSQLNNMEQVKCYIVYFNELPFTFNIIMAKNPAMIRKNNKGYTIRQRIRVKF